MNADERLKQRELISALADGQLSELEIASTLNATSVDNDARACWQIYHLVGDVLRSEEVGASVRDGDFVARLNTRLQAESGATRFVKVVEKFAESKVTVDPQVMKGGQELLEFAPAANEGSFRWKLVAGFASLAAVAAISWNFDGLLPDAGGGGGGLARSSAGPENAPVLLANAPAGSPATQVMIRDRRLDELVAAHRQFGGNSALQNPSGFLRNATFEGVSR